MLKNIFQKIRSLWRNKVEDTTKEWEETGEEKPEIKYSGYIIVVDDVSFLDRLKLLFLGRFHYRLKAIQAQMIIRDPLKEEI